MGIKPQKDYCGPISTFLSKDVILVIVVMSIVLQKNIFGYKNFIPNCPICIQCWLNFVVFNWSYKLTILN